MILSPRCYRRQSAVVRGRSGWGNNLNMSKLKAFFDNPDAGWVMLTIRFEGGSLDIVASHIYDCFSHLTNALHRLLVEQGEVIVTLQGEPIEYDLRFVRVGSNISLAIERFPGPQRNRHSRSQVKLLLSVSGTYDEICLPFWRALRALQGRLSEEELKVRWREPFPTQELSALTAAIRPQNENS
jgi:hypothetical protein